MDPITAHRCVGQVAFFRMLFVNAGDRHHGHAHSFDHPTILNRGSIKVISNGQESIYREDETDIIYIPAFVQHEIIALEAGTKVTCVQPLRRRDNPGLLIEAADVPKGTPPWSLVVPLLLADALEAGFKLEELRQVNEDVARGAVDGKTVG